MTTHSTGREQLEGIAHAAMLQRGLLPDFSAAVIAETGRIARAAASAVERQVRKSAAALLLTPRIGARFEGIVTGASDKGTWVRVAGPAAEGRIVRGFEGLDVGERVRVQLVHTDVARGFIDFSAVGRRP